MMIMAGMLTVPQLVCGDVIPVENAGFEDPVLRDNGYVDFAPGWDLYNPAEIFPGGIHGCVNPPTDAYPDEAPEGENVGWVYLLTVEEEAVLGLSQTLKATLQADTTYTLTVLVGNPDIYDGLLELEGFPGYRIELRAGETVLDADDNTLVLDDGEFGLSSIKYTAGPDDPNLGLPLTIRMINLLDTLGSEVDFDDVMLTAEPGLPCPWDIDGTGDVGISDLLDLLADWGPCKGCPSDFDGNDDVGIADLLELLANWGECP